MSLKAIDIDPFLLAGIYRQPLIQQGTETSGLPAAGAGPVPSLGNNRQNILLLIHNDKEAYLDEQTFTMLTNLLNACRLTLDDVALVNTAHLAGISLYALSQNFMPHRVIIFGSAFPEMTAQNQKNHPWEASGCHFLHTDTLQAMNSDKQLKLPFWNALRQFFNLGI